MTEDEEEWDICDVSTHIQPKRKRVTSTVSRSEDGDVVLSLGEEPQFCAQDEQNDASHIYIDSGDMLTKLVNAYTGGVTNTPEVAGNDVEVMPLTKTKEQEAPAPKKNQQDVTNSAPFAVKSCQRMDCRNISSTVMETRLRVIISAHTVGETSLQIKSMSIDIWENVRWIKQPNGPFQGRHY